MTEEQVNFFEGDSSDEEWTPQGLTSEEISKIPITTEIPEGSSCCICLLDFVVNSTARRLECHHYFHEQCIIPWLESKSTCPLCRHLLTDRLDLSIFDSSPDTSEVLPRVETRIAAHHLDVWRHVPVRANPISDLSETRNSLELLFGTSFDEQPINRPDDFFDQFPPLQMSFESSSEELRRTDEIHDQVVALPPGENLNPTWLEYADNGRSHLVEFDMEQMQHVRHNDNSSRNLRTVRSRSPIFRADSSSSMSLSFRHRQRR